MIYKAIRFLVSLIVLVIETIIGYLLVPFGQAVIYSNVRDLSGNKISSLRFLVDFYHYYDVVCLQSDQGYICCAHNASDRLGFYVHKEEIPPYKIAEYVKDKGVYNVISCYNLPHTDFEVYGKIFVRQKELCGTNCAVYVMLMPWGDLLTYSNFITEFGKDLLKMFDRNLR